MSRIKDFRDLTENISFSPTRKSTLSSRINQRPTTRDQQLSKSNQRPATSDSKDQEISTVNNQQVSE